MTTEAVPTITEIALGWNEFEMDAEESARSDTFERVSTRYNNDWRHGGTITDVFKRKSDGAFFRVSYRVATDGEYHGMREGHARGPVVRVYPHEKTIVEYRTEP